MDKPRIAVCLPGEMFTHKFLVSWNDLYAHMIKICDHVYLSYSVGTFLNEVRNKAVGGNPETSGADFEPWNGMLDYTHMLWIDSDMTDFEPWMLDRLLDLDHLRVVGACYAKSDLSSMTAAVADETGQPHNLIRLPDAVTPVVYMGFGFLLIKRGVLEQMPYPWFDHIYMNAPYLPLGRKQVGEDVSFFNVLQQTGIKAYMDPVISKKIGHEKMVSRKYADVLKANGMEG